MTHPTLAEQVRAYLDLGAYVDEATVSGAPVDRVRRELDAVRNDIRALLDAPADPSTKALADATRSYLTAQDEFNRCASRGGGGGAAALDSPARRMERARRDLEQALQDQLQLDLLPEQPTPETEDGPAAAAPTTARPRAHQMRILVAVDRGEPAQWAFEVGAELAVRTTAKVLLVHALPPPTSLVGEFVVVLQDLDTKHRDEADALLQKFQSMLPRAVDSHIAVREGAPAEQILAAADEWRADLIVMGTHSRGRLARLLLGSTAEDLIRRSTCPVITVAERAQWAIPLEDLASPLAEDARRDAHATTP